MNCTSSKKISIIVESCIKCVRENVYKAWHEIRAAKLSLLACVGCPTPKAEVNHIITYHPLVWQIQKTKQKLFARRMQRW